MGKALSNTWRRNCLDRKTFDFFWYEFWPIRLDDNSISAQANCGDPWKLDKHISMSFSNLSCLFVRNPRNWRHHKWRNDFWTCRVNTETPITSLNDFFESRWASLGILSNFTWTKDDDPCRWGEVLRLGWIREWIIRET
jgi:hypothetical protein